MILKFITRTDCRMVGSVVSRIVEFVKGDSVDDVGTFNVRRRMGR
jgi:hypothetical protein